MQSAKRIREREEEMQLLNHTPHILKEDDAEFSSEPMPAAFSACLFLGATLLLCAVAAIFW